MVEKGEDPIIAGLRELEEETGYVGENPKLLGTGAPMPQFCPTAAMSLSSAMPTRLPN